MTPEPVEVLVERVRKALDVGIGPHSDFPMDEDHAASVAALTELAERMKAAEERERNTFDRMEEHAARAEAAERVRSE